MKLQKESCPSCSASITFEQDTRQVACPYCGSTWTPVGHGGTVTLALAEEGRKALEQSSTATHTAIAESSQAVQAAISQSGTTTQSQLRQMQLSQELNTEQMELASVQRQIRQLQTNKRMRGVRKELERLQAEERALKQKVRATRRELNAVTGSGAQADVDSTFRPAGFGTWVLAIVQFMTILYGVTAIGEAMGFGPVGAIPGIVLGIFVVARILDR